MRNAATVLDVIRTLRVHRQAGSPSPAQTRRPQPSRSARQTRMGAPHGETAPQDPGHLPDLPRRHPRRSDTHIHPELTLESRVSGKPTSTVREEADRKGPTPRATRWRPLHSASDLGKRTGSNPGTAPQVDSTPARFRPRRPHLLARRISWHVESPGTSNARAWPSTPS